MPVFDMNVRGAEKKRKVNLEGISWTIVIQTNIGWNCLSGNAEETERQVDCTGGCPKCGDTIFKRTELIRTYKRLHHMFWVSWLLFLPCHNTLWHIVFDACFLCTSR